MESYQQRAHLWVNYEKQVMQQVGIQLEIENSLLQNVQPRIDEDNQTATLNKCSSKYSVEYMDYIVLHTSPCTQKDDLGLCFFAILFFRDLSRYHTIGGWNPKPTVLP